MKNLKSEKGAITIIVLVSVLFMVSFLISAYVIVANKVQTQKEVIQEIKRIYEPERSMDEIYNSYFDTSNVIPISNVENLLKIGSEEEVNINNKIYTFSNDAIYILKNDLEFSAIELDLEEDWVNVPDRIEFEGIFDFGDNTITVTNLDGSTITYPITLRLKEGVSYVAYADLSADLKQAVDDGKVREVLSETVGLEQVLAVVPTGFTVIEGTEGTASISDGLVIKDEYDNEFVWIPVPAKNMQVATTSNPYVGKTRHSEPKELTGTDSQTNSQQGGPFEFDSQEELDYYYGTGYFTYPNDISDENNVTDFSYGVHYKEMAESVNKYGGFYIGRYETTIDNNNNVGSKYNTEVLNAGRIIKSGTNPNNSESYYYLWWGLYYAQRHANVSENGTIVQTNMIWGQEWDKMIAYFDSKSIDYSVIDTTNTYNKPSSVLASGQATYVNKSDNTDVIKDEIFNIYDSRKNCYEWTAEAYSSNGRVYRSGNYSTTKELDYRNDMYPIAKNPYNRFSPYTLYKVIVRQSFIIAFLNHKINLHIIKKLTRIDNTYIIKM